MDKPILVARAELTAQLFNSINSSGLPIYVVEPILDSLHREVLATMQQQFIKQKAEYDEAMSKNKE